jgi:hypothetical protein
MYICAHERTCARTCAHAQAHACACACARACTFACACAHAQSLQSHAKGADALGDSCRESPCSRAEQRSLRAAGEWEAVVVGEDVEVVKSAGTWMAERVVEEEYVPGSARRRWSR